MNLWPELLVVLQPQFSMYPSFCYSSWVASDHVKVFPNHPNDGNLTEDFNTNDFLFKESTIGEPANSLSLSFTPTPQMAVIEWIICSIGIES